MSETKLKHYGNGQLYPEVIFPEEKVNNAETTFVEKKDMSCWGKTCHVFWTVTRPVGIIICFYFFICALNLLSSGFILVGGRLTESGFANNSLLTNPICGLMIGVVATAIFQSSSTSTSIVVTLVASNIITVQLAIPIVMGANIGTSVTSTLVAMGQVGNREQFKNAFSGATVHDMFNWLTVLILLPLEMLTGYLYRLTTAITSSVHSTGGAEKYEFISLITKPFTNLIVQVDKKALTKIAANEPGSEDLSLLKIWCKTISVTVNSTDDIKGTTPNWNDTHFSTSSGLTTLPTPSPTEIIGVEKCEYLFQDSGLSEQEVGGLVVLIALVMLVACLFGLVKILRSLLEGPMAKVIQKTINADFPGPAACLTGYVAILVGAVATVLVQSSSVVSSALTPLVGMGVVTVDRVYPLLIGANIGTTSTSILAAFAASGTTFQPTLQISLCHLFFNLTGIVIWYPVPVMRRVPLRMAKFLGETTATYRWFAVLYLVGMFLVIPMAVFGLSIPGWQVMVGVLVPILLLLICVGVLNVLQHRCAQRLPAVLRTWDFLPEPLRSLAPLDRLIMKFIACCSCCKCCQKLSAQNSEDETAVTNELGDVDVEKQDLQAKVNPAFDSSLDSGISYTPLSGKSPTSLIHSTAM